MAKKGTEKEPAYSFKVVKREHFSQALGIGFIHQMLQLKTQTDGPTEIGGLVVDKNYRRHPEKVGKLVSFARFNFIGLAADQFESVLMAEMAPPLTPEGRNEFWEALGRRFTGMPYQEADLLSQKDKEFIHSLFPDEDIYLCLLDSKARLAMGRVSVETQPALHLLESIGFEYIFEVDPFDGGPHIASKAKNVSLVRTGVGASFKKTSDKFSETGLIGRYKDGRYRCTSSKYKIKNGQISLPKTTAKILKASEGDKLFITPVDVTKREPK